MKSSGIAAVLIFVAAVFISRIHGSVFFAIISSLMLLVFCLPAYPLIRFLLGRGPLAWIFAFPAGYTLQAFFLAVWGKLFGINIATLVLQLILSYVAAVIFSKKNLKLTGESWNKSDLWMLLLWLSVVIASVAIPFLHVGYPTAAGYAYRAYFNADFFRNMAVSASLAHTGIPPNHPYFSGQSMGYYWFFHLIPAYWMKLFPSFPLESIMLQFHLAFALMFVAALFGTIRHFTASCRVQFAMLPLFLFGGSYEGLYVLYQLHIRKMKLLGFTDWNIDAILRWFWNAPQVDTLFRPLLYAPMHIQGLIIFLLVILCWQSCTSLAQRLLLYALLFVVAGSTIVVAGPIIVGVALLLLWETIQNPRGKWIEILISFLMGSGLLTLYYFTFHMFNLLPGGVKFGINTRILSHLPGFIIFNWGAILLVGIAGLIRPGKSLPLRILSLYLALCVFLILFITIDAPGFSEITMKMGYISFVVLLILAAGFIENFKASTRTLILVLSILLLPGLLTWGMDLYNHQDIRNEKFTTFVPYDDAAVLKWMRTSLEETATVQNYWQWMRGFLGEEISEVPPLAERSVYLGDKIQIRLYQIPEKERQGREKIVNAIFHLKGSGYISQICQQIGIQYLLLLSRDELSQFRAHLMEPYFQLVQKQGEARLYRVVKKELVRTDLDHNALLQDVDGDIMLEVYYRDGFFDPVTRFDLNGEISWWMNKEGTLELFASKRMRGILSFSAYSEPYRRYVEVWFNGTKIAMDRAKIRGVPVSVKIQLLKGKNIVRLREPDSYPGKKGPTEADRTGRIYRVEGLSFSPIWQ